MTACSGSSSGSWGYEGGPQYHCFTFAPSSYPRAGAACMSPTWSAASAAPSTSTKRGVLPHCSRLRRPSPMSRSCASSTTRRHVSPHPTDRFATGVHRHVRDTVSPVRRYLVLVTLVAACSGEGSASKPADKSTDPERKLAGVFPDRFQCDSILKTDQVAELLGAVKANKLDSAMSTPKGVPQPCNYEVVMQSALEYWTFDFDCRDHMKERADALFAQYKRTSSELVQQYDQMSDAGLVKPTDAGVVVK